MYKTGNKYSALRWLATIFGSAVMCGLLVLAAFSCSGPAGKDKGTAGSPTDKITEYKSDSDDSSVGFQQGKGLGQGSGKGLGTGPRDGSGQGRGGGGRR